MFEIITLGDTKTVSSKAACNHVYVIDCSYSMAYDLPSIRQQLKNIISVVAQPLDTFTAIWFSSKNQCGVVFERVLISDVSTISLLHSAIDRWVKPVGSTSFIDPIQLAATLALDKSKLNNFVMMTDGYDNASKRDDVIKSVSVLKPLYDSVSFIEYGYYADRDLLSKMANEVGGLHIFAEGFTQYEKALETTIGNTVRVNNVSVAVNKRAKHCMFIYGDQIRIVPVVDGLVNVPEDTTKIYSVVPKDILSKQLSAEHLYLVLYYASRTSNDELVLKCLQALGDVALFKAYQNAFTKQELSTFEEAVANAVLDQNARFVEGRNLDLFPNKNAKTIIDLLRMLSEFDYAALVTDGSLWNYKKTGAERVTDDVLPKFKPSLLQNNIPLKSVVFNSKRPNVSISTDRYGRVLLPENDFGLTSVPSKIVRNYTIIRDGIRNIDNLPVTIDRLDYESLREFKHDVVERDGDSMVVNFDLTAIPVINRSMVESVSIEDYLSEVTKVEILKANLKVLKYILQEQDAPNTKTVAMSETYGEEAAAWLSKLGIRDYGFSPVGTSSGETSDTYEAIQIDYKIAGLSSLPAVNAVLEKVRDNALAEKEGKKLKKINLAEQLLIEAYESFSTLSPEDCIDLLISTTSRKRLHENTLANYVYSLVLGRKWFGDTDLVETTIEIAGNSAPIKLIKERKSIAI
ncbi:hypothetical protein [Alishewanella phage vB_AspM_Slickus01]|nr:hypothetical protein [Alishewanella phage vB_AspM_Slickus01]